METLLRKYIKYFAYGVLAVSVILMTYVIYEIAQARRQFADQLITRSVNQTEIELDQFFGRITRLVDAVGQQYDTGFWNGQSLEKTVLHNISLIDNYAPISSIGIADRRGHELNVIPDSTDGYWLTRQVFVDRWGYVARWRRWRLTDSLVVTDRWEDSLSIDSRDRPWYRGAIESAGAIYWTEPYAYTTGPVIGITASKLLQNGYTSHNGLPNGILAVDLTLDDLNTFVGDLELTNNQNIFLLTGDNREVIALHNYSPDLNPKDLKSAMLPSPKQLGNEMLLQVLNRGDKRQAFSFSAGGATWWGTVRPYHITGTRTINIVSLLPEYDFALEINRTLWVGIGSFILIIILSLLLVWNHNRLHRIGNLFSEKNKLISDQKRVLLSEVHHRVKNNLAFISAFMELDLMKMKDSPESGYLEKNRHRVKIIAIVQEEGYQSEVLGMVPVGSLVSKIADIATPANGDTDPGIRVTSEPIDININQALTYGMLINELLHYATGRNGHGKDGSPPAEIDIDITRREFSMRTRIRAVPPSSASTAPEEAVSILPEDSDVCEAFIRQLDASVERRNGNGVTCVIEFALKEQKGIVSSTSIREKDGKGDID